MMIFASGMLEALKWFALILMTGDHINTALFDRALPVLSEVSRIVFPIFAVVFGYNLARPTVDLSRVANRLFLVALVAQPFHAVALGFGALPLNVLFTLLAAVTAVVAAQRGRLVAAVFVVLLSGVVVDYAWPGVCLVLFAWQFFRKPTLMSMVWVFLSASGLYLSNGNFYALLAFPVIALVALGRWNVPRWPWAFYAFYPAHLALLAAFSWYVFPAVG